MFLQHILQGIYWSSLNGTRFNRVLIPLASMDLEESPGWNTHRNVLTHFIICHSFKDSFTYDATIERKSYLLIFSPQNWSFKLWKYHYKPGGQKIKRWRWGQTTHLIYRQISQWASALQQSQTPATLPTLQESFGSEPSSVIKVGVSSWIVSSCTSSSWGKDVTCVIMPTVNPT